MKKAAVEKTDEVPLEGMILQCKTEKYKLGYAALRWAKEIKQKENLPDPIQAIVPRALRDILSGDKSIKDVEKLPMAIKVAPQPQPQAPQPTITLNVKPEEKEAVIDDEDEDEDDKDAEDEE